MLINAKYDSVCKACTRKIKAGERVSWTKGVSGVSHAACSTEGKAVSVEVAQSKAISADIELPCPEGLEYMAFQRAGIAYALKRECTLIADEMGLGKTVQAIGVINATPEIKRVLVICPASLKLNWQKEITRWCNKAHHTVVWHSKSKPAPVLPDSVCIDVINYDILRIIPENSSYDLLICDESHYVKNPKSQRTKHVQRITRNCKRKILLTGTPILNKPIELYPMLEILGSDLARNFFGFAKRYCNAHQEWIPGVRKYVWNFDGASNLEELQERLRSTVMVRRLKADVLTELPQKRRATIPIAPNGASGLLDDETNIAGKWSDEEIFSHKRIAFEDIANVRHEIALAKVDYVVQHVKNALDSGEKIVVFAHHHDVIHALQDGLKEYRPVILTGDTPQVGRQEAVEAFQNNPAVKVFIGSITAAGVGLTLTASSHVVFAELTFVPGEMIQAEDRCHRIGQREQVLVEHIVFEGSLDERMSEILIAKQEVADLALDREVGIPENTTEQKSSAIPENTYGLSDAEVQRIHSQLKFLAGSCDGARELDGRGFNKFDTAFGKELAFQSKLSYKQALAAKRMLVKYARQLEGV